MEIDDYRKAAGVDRLGVEEGKHRLPAEYRVRLVEGWTIDGLHRRNRIGKLHHRPQNPVAPAFLLGLYLAILVDGSALRWNV